MDVTNSRQVIKNAVIRHWGDWEDLLKEVEFDLASLIGKHGSWRRNSRQREWNKGIEPGEYRGWLEFWVHVGRRAWKSR